MVIRTIGLIALGLVSSSITPIAYGPLAIIAAPWCLGVCIWAAIELNRETVYVAKKRYNDALDKCVEKLKSVGLYKDENEELV